MCEHEFVFGRINATHCKRCNDTEQEIILREQLTAANARVAELEGQVKQLHYCLIKDGEYIGEYQAKNKRMEDALREISNVTSKCLSHEEMKDKMKKIAKAVLEDKS